MSTTEPDAPTNIDGQTLQEAVDTITDLPGVRESTTADVWATFRCRESLQGAIQAALTARGVVVHKVDRSEEFLSVVLDDHADEI